MTAGKMSTKLSIVDGLKSAGVTYFTAAMMCIMPLPAHAADTKPVRKEITVRQLSPIEFGAFTSGNSGGTVTIDAKSGGRSSSGGIATLGGNYGQAEFSIEGHPGEEVTIYLPDQLVLDGKGGAGSVRITKLVSEPPAVVMLDPEGRAKVKVGGMLNVSGGAYQGQYNGHFNLDVRYLH